MAKIRFLTDGIEAEVSDGTLVMDACEDSGASLPFGCAEGFCGTCTMVVKEGLENLAAPTEKERERLADSGLAEGLRLGCQAVLERGELAFENG